MPARCFKGYSLLIEAKASFCLERYKHLAPTERNTIASTLDIGTLRFERCTTVLPVDSRLAAFESVWVTEVWLQLGSAAAAVVGLPLASG